MRCLTELALGEFRVTSPQPTELSNCVYLIAQPHELPSALMVLTPEEGLQVGGLLATVLVVGFTFRAIARALNVSNDRNENE